MSVQAINITLPRAYERVFTPPARYRIVYGGRGKGASWSFARMALIRGMERPTRILCGREIQRTINDSVHQLLKKTIETLGLQSFYRPLQGEIRGVNGTTIGYAGLRHNATELKSWEGAHIAWITEATNVSRASWNILTPTIREPGSEIWVDFNPELATDETYQRFVVKPPKDSVIAFLTIDDNEFANEILKAEREDLRERDPAEARVVWDGQTRAAVVGAIYAEEIAEAEREGRIGRVAHDPSLPVDTHWDLGFGNNTSITFTQRRGLEYAIIDYIQGSLKKLSWYQERLVEKQVKRKFSYGTHYLPHDARSESLGADSIESQVRAFHPRVDVIPAVDEKRMGINAVRNIFPLCHFDADRCADLLQCLRHYRWATSPDGRAGRAPQHDEWSDGADSFQTFALSRGRRGKARAGNAKATAAVVRYGSQPSSGSWMAG